MNSRKSQVDSLKAKVTDASRKAQVESRQAKGAVASRKPPGSRKAQVFGAVCALGLVACVAGWGQSVSAQQYSFEEVASGLKHRDAATRLRAIQILADADYAEAAAPIANVLGDSDDRVQLAAIEAERSLFLLRPVSRRRRVGFIFETRTTTGAAAEGQLALKPRRVPPELVGGLVLALSDSNPRVRAAAIELASILGPVACRPERTGCPQMGNALIENINSREPALRRAAMQALGRLQYSNAVQALLDQFSYYQKGADARVAAEALARIGHAAAISTFEPLLASSDADLRRFAVEGLARAGHRDATAALQQMAQTERSGEVLLALHFANLKMDLPGSSAMDIVAATRDEGLRPLAVQYLLDLAPSIAPAIAEGLRDPDPEVRRLVADVLGFSGNASVAPLLAQAASDQDADAALAARRAAERLKL